MRVIARNTVFTINNDKSNSRIGGHPVRLFYDLIIVKYRRFVYNKMDRFALVDNDYVMTYNLIERCEREVRKVQKEDNQQSLLYHMMKEEWERSIRNALDPLSDLFGKTETDDIVLLTETRIYIGLNDATTKEQLFETEKYMDILKKVCQSYKVPFSVNTEEGGYYHEDGTYTEEKSFVLLLIGAERETVKDIARDLCTLFNQESVLVTENQIGGYFISRETKE